MAEVNKEWRMTPRQRSLREMERVERDAKRKTERGNVSTQRRLSSSTMVSEEPAEEASEVVEEVVEEMGDDEPEFEKRKEMKKENSYLCI